MSGALAKLDRTGRSRPRRERLHEKRGYKRRIMEDEATNRTLALFTAGLVEARKRLGVSQLAVDASLRQNKGQCCRWENGVVRLSLYNAVRYARALGLELTFRPLGAGVQPDGTPDA